LVPQLEDVAADRGAVVDPGRTGHGQIPCELFVREVGNFLSPGRLGSFPVYNQK
jgi:hypothetical protein